LETLTTGYTELEQDKQKLTEENTKLKQQVEQQDVQLHDLKSHQVLLIEEDTQLKSRHEIFTQQLQTLNTNQEQLAQDKKALQDENVGLKGQVADLQRQLATGTTVPAPRPLIQRWNTRQGDDRSWDDVAKRFLISTTELFRLNPDINANTPFNYDKELNVPSVTKPGGQ
jgi:DNA repair exonuclease SbcCD ATPase subunit